MGLFRVLRRRKLLGEFRGMTPKEWLESERNYEQGRQLYAALGDNARLKQLLASGPSSYNTEAVAWELTKLARAGIVTSVITATVTAAPALVPIATETLQSEPVAPPASSPLLDELRAARRPLYDERTGLHNQLEYLDTDEDRKQVGIRIMALSRQIDTNWNTTRYVAAHGQLPPPPPPPLGLDTLSPVELVKKRNALRSQVSKLKKNPARADDLVQAQTDLSAVEALLRHE